MWVFCDLDGTLLDTRGALRAAYDAFLGLHGRSGDDAEFAALDGPALVEIVAHLRKRHHLAPSDETLLAQYRVLLASVYDTHLRPCPGADAFLAGLTADGHYLGLVTAAPVAAATAAISALGWVGRFAVRVGGDEVLRAKPAPDLYLLALGRAGCGPADSLAVEDSRNGVRAALDAGLTVLAVHGAPAEAPRATATPDLAAALAWIRGRR